jgi:hypothetical protein
MLSRESKRVRIMNIKARDTVAFVSSLIVLALTLFATTSFAQTPGKSIKDQLVGHWQLVSVTINDTAPYGDNPQGSMFFDADGNYSVIVLSGGNAKNISYFGTYTVNDAESMVTLHVDGSSRGNVAGHDHKRLVTFSGEELITSTPTSPGRRGSIKLTWKR